MCYRKITSKDLHTLKPGDLVATIIAEPGGFEWVYASYIILNVLDKPGIHQAEVNIKCEALTIHCESEHSDVVMLDTIRKILVWEGDAIIVKV